MPVVLNNPRKKSNKQNSFIKKSNQSGFTLIEMAVVMIIVGIIISIAATVMPTLIQAGKVKKTEAILTKIDYAIQGYIAANARLPFPDTVSDDGLEDIPTTPTDYFGDLPFLTLGLTSDEDVWGNRIKYGVHSDLTDSTTFGVNLSTVCSTLDVTKLHVILENGTQLNMAYVLVSGGAKDEDNIQGFFDGNNTGNDAGYEDPNQISIAKSYDDHMIAKACSELSGQERFGVGTPGTPSAGFENTDELCTNGIDDDGDGKIDCWDQDCCGTGVTASLCTNCPPLDDVAIDSTPDPITEGLMGQTGYNHTFTADGGSDQYYWYLNSISPSISGLSINLWSGILSGTLDACEGDYTVEVKVEDRQDSSITDTRQFTLTLTKDSLNVSPSPSGGGTSNPDFTVNSSVFTHDLSISGTHSGEFTWAINWTGDDPGGFQLVETSATSSRLEKFDPTTEGSFTFTLNITDKDCPGNTIVTPSYTMVITGGGVPGPIPEGMESRWYFDECDTWSGSTFDVVDSLGNTEFYGKASGGVAQTGAGRFCRAASFDGGDDKIVSKVFTTDIIVFTDETTLACWFKSPGGGNGSPRLIEFSDELGDYQKSTAIAYDRDGSLRAWVTSESGVRGGAVDYSATRYADNKWHHAVYTYGSGTGTLYIDGVEKASATNNPTTDIHDAETFVMGGYYPNTSHGYKGLIDEVMIYSKALSQEEVTDLYNTSKVSCTGSCYDDSTTLVSQWSFDENSWNGTADEVVDAGFGENHGVAATTASGTVPTQTTTTGGKPNMCRSGVFTRVSSSHGGYIDFGDPSDLDPGSSNLTISTWFNWDGSSGENIIYNKENLYEVRVSGGYLNYAWRPHWYWDGGTSFTVNAGEWTHLAVVYDGNSQIMYKNGLEVYSREESGSIGSTTNKFLIGARGSGSPRNFFGGMIDQFKVYNRALATNEIVAEVSASQECPADLITITTTALSSGVVGSVYPTSVIEAEGGTLPYGWSIVPVSPISGLSMTTSLTHTGELSGTINVCSGTYDIVVKVTDGNSGSTEATLPLVVVNGTITISPSPQQYISSAADTTFTVGFTVGGAVIGDFDFTDTLTWLGGNDPGGFVLSSEDEAAQTITLNKTGESAAGSYFFRITGTDTSCGDNTFESGWYGMTVFP